jgi:hypothetical protein
MATNFYPGVVRWHVQAYYAYAAVQAAYRWSKDHFTVKKIKDLIPYSFLLYSVQVLSLPVVYRALMHVTKKVQSSRCSGAIVTPGLT